MSSEGYIDTPGHRGCFCHNPMCSLHRLQGFPENFHGPITVDQGYGDREALRINATTRRRPKDVFWLCDTCDMAVKIAAGIVESTLLAPDLEPIVETGLIRPN